MSSLKDFFEEHPTTYMEGKRDPSPVEIEEKGKSVFFFNPIQGWKWKGLEIKNGNLVITLGKDEPVGWEDFTF